MLTLISNFFSLKPIRDNSVSKLRRNLSIGAIFISQVLDAISTVYGISIHNANEANGIMAQFINSYGLNNFILLKLFAASFLSWSLCQRKYAPWIVSGLYFGVFIWNLIVIFILS